MAESRTAKSIKNSLIATLFYIVNIGLQFFSRKIFLDYLGTEILGLNTTAMNLLQFLNLAELGISAAVGFTLYKPIHENDQSSINEIITLQGYIYRRIAYIIIIGASILMAFFPLIFNKISLPLWYTYASFGVLLYSALLGYFFNYKQIVLTASQQDYKVQYSYKSVMILKVAVQMLAVRFLTNGYEWWLICEVLFSSFASLTLHKMTISSFPALTTVNIPFIQLKDKYVDFTKKIKQLFFHKIGGFALTQSSPLIIYAYTNLDTVALYGNYLIITTGITALLSAVFNGINASVGNLIAEGNRSVIEKVFKELYSVRFLLVTTICYVTYYETQNFLELWIGNKYLLTSKTLLLIVISLYISLTRFNVDQFINGYGLFQDIYAPIIEAFLNISLSVFLGAKYGLDGVLIGVIISQIIIVKIWKPYFLCKKGLVGFLLPYILLVVKHLGCATVTFLICNFIRGRFLNETCSGFFNWSIQSTVIALVYGITLTLFLILTKGGINLFFSRFISRFK